MSSQAAQKIRQNQQQLAEAIVELQYARQPQVWKPYDHPGREKSVHDAGYHLLYLTEALEAQDESLFIEYLAWAKSLFKSLNFPEDVLPTSLECTRAALSANLAKELLPAVLEMLETGLKSLSEFRPELASFIEEDNLLARQFLELLLKGSHNDASRLIVDAVKSGLPVREVYLNVFQKTQREVGRLWHTNQIGVAQEHFCSAATQVVMARLYPFIFSGERKDRRMVMACVGGELHEIGARMVADFFEMEGWDTYFLGSNTPPESILQATRERQADVLGLSVTMTFHISKAQAIIRDLRAQDNISTRVLVGGYPFNLSPDLWKQIGADGYAPDAQTALREAERVLL
jgi:MerR family transcriptional regulator, light-induced transcriptional regulator